MAADSGKWFVIVNPVAGSGRGLDHFPQISKHLRDAHILCEPVFTEHKFHATELTVTAVTEDGVVMAVQHRTLPIYGVQFHPESILTPDGNRMLENFLKTE